MMILIPAKRAGESREPALHDIDGIPAGLS